MNESKKAQIIFAGILFFIVLFVAGAIIWGYNTMPPLAVQSVSGIPIAYINNNNLNNYRRNDNNDDDE